MLLVCEPLIRLSSVLTEDDLLSLVREPPGEGSRTTVARRPQLAGPVCEAVVESGDVTAMAALLRNPTARIPPEPLGVLEVLAGHHPSLQEPLASRSALAALVADDVLSQWVARPAP